jgi:HAE1 family hydrophobic/amphiphilic exporter-1
LSLTSASVARPVSTIAAVLGLVLLGSVSLGRLPVALLPDVTLPVLTIRTDLPGAAPPEISRFVAEPIEEAIAATPGLVELRSVARTGQLTTTARFAWGTDMATTVLTVRERLDNARGLLPDQATRPTLLTSDPSRCWRSPAPAICGRRAAPPKRCTRGGWNSWREWRVSRW